MNYCILRTQKLKSIYAVNRSLKHAFREQVTPNADPERTPENLSFFSDSKQDALERFKQILPEKRRKNAVPAIEYLITASPESMQGKSRDEQMAYFNDSIEWLKQKHGEQNIVNVGIHFDETTPHLYAYVVPIDERGKLNCRGFLGGSKALSDMQTDFAEKVGKKHGLQRGLKNSKARHTRISKYYANLNKAERTPKINPDDVNSFKIGEQKGVIFKKDIFETDEQIAKRLERDYLKPYSDKIKKLELTYVEEQKRLRTKNNELLQLIHDRGQYVYIGLLKDEQKQELVEKAKSYDIWNTKERIDNLNRADEERLKALEQAKKERLEKAQKRSRGMKI